MKKILTKMNQEKLDKAFKAYLESVMQDEEFLNTFDMIAADVKRVKCYHGQRLNIAHIDDYLRGLPLNTMFMTYNIVKFICKELSINIDDIYNDKYKDGYYELDSFYWQSLARTIYLNSNVR